MAKSLLTFLKKRPFISAWILFFVAIAAALTHAALMDDYDVKWTRSVPSKHPVGDLGQAIDDLTVWPIFHHNLKQANVRDASGKDLTPEESRLQTGQTLRYMIEPPQRQWKRFEFYGTIKDYQPSKRLEVEFESDSTGKLTRLFDRFSWSVEVEPATDERLLQKGFKSVARGEAQARTINWRGRFFGTYTPRILMNQVYYLDLVKLGTLERQIEARKSNSAPNYQ